MGVTKTLKITRGEIRVSSTLSPVDGKPIVSTEIWGVLPGCRKEVKLTWMVCAKRLIASPLCGRGGEACVAPWDYIRLVKSFPVVSDRFFPVELTPELLAHARKDAEYTATCPAVTNPEFCHPDFKPVYDRVEFAG